MIYLDHAATGLPRSPDAIAAAARASDLASPGRGLHSMQAAAAAACEGARDCVARLLPAGRVIVFTAGATSALCQALLGIRPQPALVASDPLLHNALRRPLARLASQGTDVWTLPHEPATGRIDVVRSAREWRTGTTLVIVTHGSNVNGVIQPVEELTDLAHTRGARVIVDAAQTAGVMMPLAIGDADLVAFSAHKGLGALPGTGVLAVSGEIELEPIIVGGTGFDSLSDEMPSELPARLEAGTPNVPGIAALGAAAVGLLQTTFDFRTKTKALADAVRRAGLEPITAGDLPIVSVRGFGLPPLEMEHALDRLYGIITRAGTHCAPQAHATLGTGVLGALRVSAGRSTTDNELAQLTIALRELRRSVEKGA